MYCDIPSRGCKRCRGTFYGNETENFCPECLLAFDFMVESAAAQTLAGILASPLAPNICGTMPTPDAALAFAEGLVSRIKDRYATDASRKG